MTDIKRSMLVQVGEHDGKVLVAISVVVSAGEHIRSRPVSAAVYEDQPSAWRAVRDFASSRVLEDAEQHITRPGQPVPPPSMGSADAPF